MKLIHFITLNKGVHFFLPEIFIVRYVIILIISINFVSVDELLFFEDKHCKDTECMECCVRQYEVGRQHCVVCDISCPPLHLPWGETPLLVLSIQGF